MAQEQLVPAALEEPASLKERVAAYERRLILEALWLAGGNAFSVGRIRFLPNRRHRSRDCEGSASSGGG